MKPRYTLHGDQYVAECATRKECVKKAGDYFARFPLTPAVEMIDEFTGERFTLSNPAFCERLVRAESKIKSRYTLHGDQYTAKCATRKECVKKADDYFARFPSASAVEMIDEFTGRRFTLSNTYIRKDG